MFTTIVFFSLLACIESLHQSSAATNTDDVAMFIAVFTAPENIEQRASVRDSWHVPEHVVYKFILCDWPKLDVGYDTTEEEQRYGDILRVPCVEGNVGFSVNATLYTTYGKLMRKTISTLRAFHDTFPKTPLFFKIDDDTYPQIDQLLFRLKGAGTPKYLVAGYVGKNQSNNKNQSTSQVMRSPDSPWYEPESIYPYDSYPPSVQAGPGYVLSASTVKFLLEQGIEDKAVPSWNEDRAVGIWVEQFPELKKGTTVFEIHATVASRNRETLQLCEYVRQTGTWGTYRKTVVMHNHISPAQMRCLGADHAEDSSDFGCICD